MPLLLCRGVFDEESRCATKFASCGKALQHARDDDQDRSTDTDHRVGRGKSNDAGTRCHQEDGQHQDGLSPFFVAIGTENDCADRPDHITQTESHEGFDELDARILAAKEITRDVHRVKGVHGEVVPLHDVADTRCRDRANRGLRVVLHRPTRTTGGGIFMCHDSSLYADILKTPRRANSPDPGIAS